MSASQPWMKFHPQDWRADEKLRLCSLAARGLWIEMLAIMHRSERYGHLVINGSVPTHEQLAVQVGASPSEVTAMLAELDGAGVFSRSASGSIYSRRMTRDAKKAKEARKNGLAGGNPTLRNQTGNPASDKGQDKPPDKARLKLRGQRPEKKASPKKIALPEGWEPEPFGPDTEAAAIEAGWSYGERKRELESFRDYHHANASRFCDWQAAWGTWVRNSVRFGKPRQAESGSFLDHFTEELARESRRAATG